MRILYKTTKDDIKSTIYRLTMKEFSSLFETQIDSDEYIEINIQTKSYAEKIVLYIYLSYLFCQTQKGKANNTKGV